MSGPLAAKVIETPGHTAGHIVYWFEEDEIVFTGDTLFSLGCGRVFEAPYSVMWDSLVKLAALPGETQVYCGHEYTEANARFALTIEPDNAVLKSRAAEVAALRAAGQPTLPTTIAAELAANPFLRAELPSGPGGARHGRRRSGGGIRRDSRAQGSLLNGALTQFLVAGTLSVNFALTHSAHCRRGGERRLRLFVAGARRRADRGRIACKTSTAFPNAKRRRRAKRSFRRRARRPTAGRGWRSAPSTHARSFALLSAVVYDWDIASDRLTWGAERRGDARGALPRPRSRPARPSPNW